MSWPANRSRLQVEFYSQQLVAKSMLMRLLEHRELPTYVVEYWCLKAETLLPSLRATIHENRQHTQLVPFIGSLK